MTLRLITAPAVEPATVDEVKLDARIDVSELDATITLLIKAARQRCEDLTGRALITQTWELVLDEFPVDGIRVGKLPIGSITSLKYYDSNGTLQTLDASTYTLDADRLPGWIYEAGLNTWPSVRSEENSVVIRFVAGYGASADDVPAELRYWIRAQAAAAVQAQSAQTDASVGMDFVNSLLDPYKLSHI
jgi:uncharacterized phiE125 gp8 family phage protein